MGRDANLKNNFSNTSLIAIILLIVILVILAIIGTIYFIKNQNNNSNTTVTLSDDELEEYLKYVPDVLDEDKYDLKEIEGFNLINNSLKFIEKNNIKEGACSDNCPSHMNDSIWEENGVNKYNYVEGNFINNLLKKMYNVTLDSLNIDNNTIFTAYSEVGGICPVYFNNNFAIRYCFLEDMVTRELKDYKATNKELIIYSYDGYITNGGDMCQINDSEDCVLGPDYGGSIDKEKDLSLCKHTFKKNDTGYYWYSTEVVK